MDIGAKGQGSSDHCGVKNTSVLDMGHAEVIKIIKTAQLDLELTIEIE